MDHKVLMNSPPIMRDFLTYSETIKGKSSVSITEYYHDLKTFFRYILYIRGMVPAEKEFNEIDISPIDIDIIKTITLSDIFSFLVYCKNERGNNAATRARKSSSIRIFFKYLTTQRHLLEVNPAEQLETPKMKKALPKHLTLEESLTLLESIEGPYKERDYCIITLFLNCGMRLSELCSLNLSDIYEDGSMRVTGKGNKERVIYLNEACVNAIKAYLPTRPNEGVPPSEKNALFLSKFKKRISNKTVQHIVYLNLERAGLSGRGLSTHKLRHTAATLMYQHGNVDIRVLKDILGHENLGTTQIYTHVSDKQVRSAIESNPLSQVKNQAKRNPKE